MGPHDSRLQKNPRQHDAGASIQLRNVSDTFDNLPATLSRPPGFERQSSEPKTPFTKKSSPGQTAAEEQLDRWKDEAMFGVLPALQNPQKSSSLNQNAENLPLNNREISPNESLNRSHLNKAITDNGSQRVSATPSISSQTQKPMRLSKSDLDTDGAISEISEMSTELEALQLFPEAGGH